MAKLQDLTLETDSLDVFEQYLRLTIQVRGIRCVEEKGYKIGGPVWEYPSEAVWQEMDDALLSKCPEIYWRICQLTGHKQFASSRQFDDENRLINEVMALIDRADKLAYLAAGKDAFAGAEGLSSVGYRLHVSGYSGITVSLCRIWNSK